MDALVTANNQFTSSHTCLKTSWLGKGGIFFDGAKTCTLPFMDNPVFTSNPNEPNGTTRTNKALFFLLQDFLPTVTELALNAVYPKGLDLVRFLSKGFPNLIRFTWKGELIV